MSSDMRQFLKHVGAFIAIVLAVGLVFVFPIVAIVLEVIQSRG